jgi:hypothetical protein
MMCFDKGDRKEHAELLGVSEEELCKKCVEKNLCVNNKEKEKKC